MPKEVVVVKLSDRLDTNTRTRLRNLSSKPKKKPEILTEKDLAELMNVNRDTYKRGKGGAVRRK